MIAIAVAGLCIGLNTKNEYIAQRCSRFLTRSDPVFTVSVTREQIEREQQLGKCSADRAEFVCYHREIAENLLQYNRFVLHGAAIQTKGLAYIFTAKSGTGKSTHILLWRKRFGEAVRIVNGDKPILWKREDLWYVCGTPWCGKEGWTSIDCVPVDGLCFLERAETNTIRRAQKNEITGRVFHQLYLPKNNTAIRKMFVLIEDFLKSTSCWIMKCNTEIDAAETAYNAMILE